MHKKSLGTRMLTFVNNATKLKEDYSLPLLRNSFSDSCARAISFKSHCRPSSPRTTTTEGNKGEHRQTRYRRNSGCIARDSACLSGIIVVYIYIYIRSYVFQQIASVDLRIGERVCKHGNGRAKEDGRLSCTLYSLPLCQLATFDVKTILFFFLRARAKLFQRSDGEREKI